jgi:hypothetical protein
VVIVPCIDPELPGLLVRSMRSSGSPLKRRIIAVGSDTFSFLVGTRPDDTGEVEQHKDEHGDDDRDDNDHSWAATPVVGWRIVFGEAGHRVVIG